MDKTGKTVKISIQNGKISVTYNDALQKSGFTQRLAFNDKINTDTEKSKKKIKTSQHSVV